MPVIKNDGLLLAVLMVAALNRSYYSVWQILLHWLSAVVVIWATLSGFYLALLEVGSDVAANVAAFNVSVTTLFIPLFILRCYFRVRWPVSVSCVAAPNHERAVKVVHNSLYGVTALVLVTGVLMMDRPVEVFSWFSFTQPLHDQSLQRIFNVVHGIACAILALLIAIHVAAVIRHVCAGRPVLKRMWFSS
jgi:cytochrome b561